MAFRTSRRVCTLGRPGALGVGMWGSMQDHSSSERSVGYVFLIRARVANYHLTTPFRTVSKFHSRKLAPLKRASTLVLGGARGTATCYFCSLNAPLGKAVVVDREASKGGSRP